MNMLSMKSLSDIPAEMYSGSYLYRSDLAFREEIQANSINLGIIHAERFKVAKLNESNKGVGVDRKEVVGLISGASNTKVGGTRRYRGVASETRGRGEV